ncbi:hypothetical protein [Fictibacillus gelatini]|uniref:hypothetical protein n=1 Tax=Fictibacillus gelatini TaxID=225985 RepID=UPI000421F7EB|nr:hypothetical protein [Fictibacillus gelatini]
MDINTTLQINSSQQSQLSQLKEQQRKEDNAWEGVTDAAEGAWNKTTDVAEETWIKAADAVENPWDEAVEIAGDTWDATNVVSNGWDIKKFGSRSSIGCRGNER